MMKVNCCKIQMKSSFCNIYQNINSYQFRHVSFKLINYIDKSKVKNLVSLKFIYLSDSTNIICNKIFVHRKLTVKLLPMVNGRNLSPFDSIELAKFETLTIILQQKEASYIPSDV